MTPRFGAVLLLAALVLPGAGIAATAPAPVGAPAAVPALGPPSAEAVLRHAAVLSRQIGPRPAGHPGFLRAVEYVEDQLRALGYAVQRQPFTYQHFEAREVGLRPVEPAGEAFHPSVLQYSASTPDAGLELPVVAAGLGRPDDLSRAGPSGRLILIERGEFTFREKVGNALAAGAAGVIFTNNQPGPVPSATLVSPSRIPAVIISQEEGERLRAMLARGPVRARLRVDTVLEQRTTWNVIGRRAGRDARTLVVGGHLDSVPPSPGANDNGSGIAAALETARLLARLPLALSVEIVGFGAEELGLFGSYAYVRERRDRVAGMINMDMVGRGPLSIGNSTGDGRLLDPAERIAGRLGLRVGRFRFGSSDHVPFEQAGIPSVFIHTGDDPAIHTPGDVFERLDGQRMAQAAWLAAAIALEAGEIFR